MKILRLVCGLAWLTGLGLALERGEEIRLWPNGAPGSEGETAAEVFRTGDNPKVPTQFKGAADPYIYVFLPEKQKANGTAVVIAPGGGHSQLVMAKEGYDIAAWLNSNGIAAFVLKYRLARAANSKYTVQGNALPDAARAMRMVRSRAGEWGVDPSKIGFMGFSAGGEVAALMETRFDAGNDSSTEAIERASSRPDFAVVVYPGFRPGTITGPKDAPPTFLVCADDDRSHVVTTVNLYLDLEKQSVSSEMNIYAIGAHGFGMKDSALPVASWPDRLKQWMVDKKLVPR